MIPFRPSAVIAGLVVAGLAASPSLAQKGGAAAAAAAANGTVTLVYADHLPAPGENAGWEVVPSGSGAGVGSAIHWTMEPMRTVPAGTYDVYYIQDHILNPEPMLMDTIEVPAGGTAEARIYSGVEASLADWILPSREEWWGATPVNGNPDDAINWTYEEDTLVLPPGTYDMFYSQDPERPAQRVFRIDVPAAFGGIGAEVRVIEGGVEVVRVVPGSGSAAAGLAAGDVITQADGEGFSGLNLDQVVTERLRGPADTDVTVSVLRNGTPLTITIRRGRVEAIARFTVDTGIRPILRKGVAPLAPTGRWGAAYRDAGPDALVNWWIGDSETPLLLGPGYYDVYWQQDENSPMRLVARGVAVAALVDVAITPEPAAQPPRTLPAPSGAAPQERSPQSRH